MTYVKLSRELLVPLPSLSADATRRMWVRIPTGTQQRDLPVGHIRLTEEAARVGRRGGSHNKIRTVRSSLLGNKSGCNRASASSVIFAFYSRYRIAKSGRSEGSRENLV
jgi:hypothetical protein